MAEPSPSRAAPALAEAASRVARRLLAGGGGGHFYTREIAVAQLLRFADVPAGGGLRDEAITLARTLRPTAAAPWAREPFGSLTWPLAEATGDRELRDGFVRETRSMIAAVQRDADGLMLHPRGAQRGGGEAVLLDSGIEHVCRLARAHAATGEALFADECLRQARGHRTLLRDPANGLWCQGRGWLAADRSALSPGAWSRGQGWLALGLADAVAVLPAGELRAELAGQLGELAEALLPRQDGEGCWHALVQRPLAESAAETSGTALIAAGLARGAACGALPLVAAEAARRAAVAVAARVDAQGVVHGACYGPGPLEEERPWLAPSFPPDDAHGPLAVLAASAL